MSGRRPFGGLSALRNLIRSAPVNVVNAESSDTDILDWLREEKGRESPIIVNPNMDGFIVSIKYRGYHIEYDPPPIPIRDHDWQWHSDDYDYAPDGITGHAGSSPSLEQARADIDELEDET